MSRHIRGRPRTASSSDQSPSSISMALREGRPRLQAQRGHDAIVAVVALQHGAPERRDRGALAGQKRHCRRLRLRRIERGEIAAGHLTQHGQRLANMVAVASERADDVGKDRIVVRARNPILRGSGDHDAGDAAQITQVRPAQPCFRIVHCVDPRPTSVCGYCWRRMWVKISCSIAFRPNAMANGE